MFERRIRFLTVRLRNWSGVKMTSASTGRSPFGRGDGVSGGGRRCGGRFHECPRLVDRVDLLDHLLAGGEAALVVAAQWVLQEVDQALVAVRTGFGRPVDSLREHVDEVVVG